MLGVARRNTGLTLIELLVVLAIIAILTASSIPVLSRLGAFASSRNDGAARELFTVLKAAQIYASANNTDTAVVYYPEHQFDSWDDGESPALTGYMVVRRLKNEEVIAIWEYQDALTNNIVTGTLGDNVRNQYVRHVTEVNNNIGSSLDTTGIRATDVFVPIRNTDLQFKKFPRDTALLLRPSPGERGALPDPNAEPGAVLSDPYYNANEFHRNTGMVNVMVFNPWIADGNGLQSGEILYPPTNAVEFNPADPLFTYGDGNAQSPSWMFHFAGHVFKPTGDLLRDSTYDSKERVTLHLGARPDAEPDDRFFDTPDKSGNYDESDPFLKDSADRLVPLTTRLRLYLSTGRTKIES